MIEEIACAIMGASKKKPTCNPPCPKPCSSCPPPCPDSSSSSSAPCPPPCPPPKPKSRPCPPPPCPPSPAKCESMEKLKRRIQSMQCSVKKLLQEVNNRDASEPCGGGDDDDDDDEEEDPCARPCPRQPCAEDPDPLVICGGKRNTKADKYEKMKENYTRLLTEFQRKDCQMKELQKR